MNDLDIAEKVEVSAERVDIVRMFALAHAVEKYWILSKTKSVFIPGFRLLFVCGCEKCDGPEIVSNSDLPSEGDIAMDYKGESYWKVKSLNWA